MFNGAIGIILAQTVQPDEFLAVGRFDSGMLSVAAADLIPGLSQFVQKGREIQGLTDDTVNVPAYLFADGRLFELGRLPFLMAFAFAVRLDD